MLIKNGKHLDLKFQYELNHKTPHYAKTGRQHSKEIIKKYIHK